MSNKKKYRIYKSGGQPCYECGGGVPYMNDGGVGGSTAPMNSNIDTEGSKRTETVVNYIGQNVANNEMKKQKEALLEQQQLIQQMMATNNFAYGGANEMFGEAFNPNFDMMRQYAGVADKSRRNTKNAFGNLFNAGIQVAQQKDVNRQHEAYMQDRIKLNTDINTGIYNQIDPLETDLSSMYDNQRPQLAIPQGGYQGVGAYGGRVGSLPKHQSDKGTGEIVGGAYSGVDNTDRNYGRSLVKRVGSPSTLLHTMSPPGTGTGQGYNATFDHNEFAAAQAAMARMMQEEGLAPPVDYSGGVGQGLGRTYIDNTVPNYYADQISGANSEGSEKKDISGGYYRDDAAREVEAEAKLIAEANKTKTGTGGGKYFKDPTKGKKEEKKESASTGEKRKGNVELKSDETGDKGSAYGTSGTSGTYGTYGYAPSGKRKTKMWVVDPETGKRKLIYKNKWKGSGAGYGFDRRNRSRKNIYNMPIYIQAPSGQGVQRNETATPSNQEFADVSQYDINAPSTDPSFGGFQESQFYPDTNQFYDPSQFNRSFDPLGDFALRNPEVIDPYADVTGEGLATRRDASKRQLRKDDRNDTRITKDLIKKYGRLKEESDLYAYGGQPFGEQQSYFYANGGGYDPNDPTGMLPKAQWGNYTDARPNQGFGSGQSDYQFGQNQDKSFGGKGIDYGDPIASLRIKDKFNQGSLNDWSPMALPTIDFISSIAEQGEARAAEKSLSELKFADATTTPETGRSRGSFNQYGEIDPSSRVYPQEEGYNTGQIGGLATTRYGGDMPKYQSDKYTGEVKVTDLSMLSDRTSVAPTYIPKEIQEGNIQELIDKHKLWNDRMDMMDSPYTAIAVPDASSSFSGDSTRFYPGQRGGIGDPYIRDLGNLYGVSRRNTHEDYMKAIQSGRGRIYQDTSAVRANPHIMFNQQGGGEPTERYITDEEAQQILAMGGNIEYIT